MATTYPLVVVTPECTMLDEEVTETSAPGSEGSLGILAHHAPLMTELIPGEVRVTFGDNRDDAVFAISGGFLEVSAEGRATILADYAERAEEIDLTRAEQDLQAAREMLNNADMDITEARRARTVAAHAETRIRAANRNR